MVVTLTAEQALAAATRSHALRSPRSSIVAVATDIVGLHNTNQVTPYLSLHARVGGFSREDLDELMWDRWELARFRAMRLTMFVFPHDLIEVAAAATRHVVEPFAARWLRDSSLTQTSFDRWADAVVEALRDGPLTSRELRSRLEAPQEVELPSIVSRLCEQGRLVGGAPPQSWKSNVRRFHLWEDALPDVDIHRWDEDAAVRELVRRYILGYGPVSLDDMSWWSGIAKSRCRTSLEALGSEIEEVVVDGWPGPLFMHRNSEVPDDAGSEVNALPLLDPYEQGYRNRGRVLDRSKHDLVWDGGGNGAATLVRGGRIVGVWQPMQKPQEIRYHLFEDIPLSEVLGALEPVGHLLFNNTVELVEVPAMTPLRDPDAPRSAAHPLDDVLHRRPRRR